MHNIRRFTTLFVFGGLFFVVAISLATAEDVDIIDLVKLFLGLITLAILAEFVRRIFLAYIVDIDRKKFISRAYWPCFVLLLVITSLCYLILLAAKWKERPGFFFDDEPFYDGVGQAIASALQSHGDTTNILLRYSSTLGQSIQPGIFFAWLAGITYYLFSHQPLLVRLLNALFGLWAAVVIFDIAGMVFPHVLRNSRRIFWLAGLSPFILIWSTSQMRDIEVASTTAIFLWVVTKSLRQLKPGLLLFGGVVFVWLYYLRPFSAYMLVIALFAGLFMWAVVKIVTYKSGGKKTLGILALLAILLIGVGLSPLAIKEITFKASQYGVDLSGGIASLGSLFNASLFKNLLTLLQPSPFWVFKEDSFYLLYQFLPGLSWYIALPFWVWGIFHSLRRITPMSWMVIVFVVLTVAMSVFSSSTNYGDPMRARVPALPFLALFSEYALVKMRSVPLMKSPVFLFIVMTYVLLFVLGIYDLLNPYLPLISVVALVGLLCGAAVLILHIIASFSGRKRSSPQAHISER